MMNFNSKDRGFTLVEMIVALALFAMVAVVAVGALLKIVDTNRKAFTLKTAINNMNLALDSMSREMRVGNSYYCSGNVDQSVPSSNPLLFRNNNASCPRSYDSEWLVAFYSSKLCREVGYTDRNVVYAYRFKRVNGQGVLQKAQQNPMACRLDIHTGDFFDLTSDDMVITHSFANIYRTNQPKAFFFFRGYVGGRLERTYFDIQTTVSQRVR